MNAHKIRTDLMSIPCPKCKRPNPIESKVCECGFVFVDDAVIFDQSSSSHFPELQSILPDYQKSKPQLRLVSPGEISPSISSPVASEPKPAAIISQAQSRSAPEIGATFLAAEPNNGSWKYLILAVAMLLTGAIGVFVGNRTAVGDQPTGSEIRQLAGPGNTNTGVSTPTDQNGISENPQEPQAGLMNVQPDLPEASAASAETLNARPTTERPRESEKNAVSLAGSSSDSNVGAINSNINDSKTSSSVPVPATESESIKDTSANLNSEKSPPNANRAVSPVARCGDGTFSYRKSGAGSCTQRGGVVEWLDGTPSNTKTVRENRDYFLGPKGGCYYLNSKGTKIYVDKSYCN